MSVIELGQLFISIIEIAIITVILNYLLSFFWNTRAMDVVFGFLAFLFLFAAASWLHLPVLKKLMLNIINVVVLAIFIIFQPEIRMALSRLLILKGRRYSVISDFDNFLDSLVSCVYRFSDKRVGALILLENQDSLEDFANKAVVLNARFSSELLDTIFTSTTPLHDGAVIIRSTTILAAAAILPLADDTSQLGRSMGTRHRAALGISQITDALIIVVSEETGTISLAEGGTISRYLTRESLETHLFSLYTDKDKDPPEEERKGLFST